MKKSFTLSILTLTLLITSHSATFSQTAASVQKKIERANKHFVKWFNSNQPDSIVTQYHTNACITGKGCGKEFLQTYYKGETGQYTFRELTTLGVTLKDNIATESGQYIVQLPNGVEVFGKYRTEWQQENNRWVIFKETVLE